MKKILFIEILFLLLLIMLSACSIINPPPLEPNYLYISAPFNSTPPNIGLLTFFGDGSVMYSSTLPESLNNDLQFADNINKENPYFNVFKGTYTLGEKTDKMQSIQITVNDENSTINFSGTFDGKEIRVNCCSNSHCYDQVYKKYKK